MVTIVVTDNWQLVRQKHLTHTHTHKVLSDTWQTLTDTLTPLQTLHSHTQTHGHPPTHKHTHTHTWRHTGACYITPTGQLTRTHKSTIGVDSVESVESSLYQSKLYPLKVLCDKTGTITVLLLAASCGKSWVTLSRMKKNIRACKK